MTRVQLFGRAAGIVTALIVVAAGAAAALYYYEFPGYCRRLETRARKLEVQRALQSWVATNWSDAHVPPGSVVDYDGIGPGVRWLPARFDGSVLGMGPGAHVRLLGPEARNILDDAIAAHVKAIYFTERSRFGVLVQLPDRERFESFELTPVSRNVAVICMK